MATSAVVRNDLIISKIYLVRGQKVMIDRDLAELYGVETRVLKQAVRRNMERFPEDFMFEMSKNEFQNWRNANVLTSDDKQGLRHAPFCFTEQGVTMLSCILTSKEAIKVNIQVIRVFIQLREMVNMNKDILLKLEQLEKKIFQHDGRIKLIFEYVKDLINSKGEPMRKIGFRREGEDWS